MPRVRNVEVFQDCILEARERHRVSGGELRESDLLGDKDIGTCGHHGQADASVNVRLNNGWLHE